MHLAELNIGRFKHPVSDPRMAEFMDNLDRVNAIAERSPGFVWRLKGDNNNATEFRVGEDMAVNLSVWADAKSLETYVFKTVHVQFYKKREAWFDLMEKPHFVLWWVPEGHRPSLDEAYSRLQRFESEGPSEEAFGWTEIMDEQRMRTLRCA
ncbi:DUF3291 domain-containing protein [Aestuariivirga sp.]|uniref:DUF3291 domain-containing protein n=1 Tax=Aestuariivirga sp. TaxID=2650926 RepID=UPI003BAC5B32